MSNGSNRTRQILPEEVSQHSGSTSRSSKVEIDPFEQVNFKVPRGTKMRVKRLALEEGGISMMAVFMQMLDEYERRRRTKR